MRYFHLDLNPVQWAIGPLSTIKRGGKMIPMVARNLPMYNYQQAVKAEIKRLYGEQEVVKYDVELKFWFWRQREDYLTHQARAHRKHEVDATNLQKSTEDALQGVLIKNDKQVRRVSSEIVEQEPGTTPWVIIGIQPYEPRPLEIPPRFPPHLTDPLLSEEDQKDAWSAPESIEEWF